MTRFYFHEALSTVSGTLPSTEQSTLTVTSGKNADALTVNRSMNTTIGTSQVSKAITTNNNTSQQILYFTRFVSFPMDTTSISANTWDYNFAANESNVSANFPVGSNVQPVYVHCYVWRPSTGAKIGTVLDGNSANSYNEDVLGNREISFDGEFSGAAVSCAQGDVLIMEIWFRITQSSNNARTCTFYYDGTTVNTSSGNTVSNHASFIETPQTINPVAALRNLERAVSDSITISHSSTLRARGKPKTIPSEGITISHSAPLRTRTKLRTIPSESITLSETIQRAMITPMTLHSSKLILDGGLSKS